eukprot:m.345398 g.345398  ORF g.345398 m.345398 type:complete len:375 (+) comp16140_c3_seq8:371-1495(+)
MMQSVSQVARACQHCVQPTTYLAVYAIAQRNRQRSKQISQWNTVRSLSTTPRMCNNESQTPREFACHGRMQPKFASFVPYGPGQPFFHSGIGYRGIVLTPWKATVHNYKSKRFPPRSIKSDVGALGECVKTQEFFYQTFCSEADKPLLRRFNPTPEPWLGSTIPTSSELSLVPHTHIQPYEPTWTGVEANSLTDSVFTVTENIDNPFLTYHLTPFGQQLQHDALPSLATTHVTRTHTEGIVVTVIPLFTPTHCHLKVMVEHDCSTIKTRLLSSWWQCTTSTSQHAFISGQHMSSYSVPPAEEHQTLNQFTVSIPHEVAATNVSGMLTFVTVLPDGGRGDSFVCASAPIILSQQSSQQGHEVPAKPQSEHDHPLR